MTDKSSKLIDIYQSESQVCSSHCSKENGLIPNTLPISLRPKIT